MDLKDVWVPYVVTHTLTLVLIVICYKWPKIGKVAWGIVFMLAGIFNIFSVNSDPVQYINGFAPYAIPLYQKIIHGPFSTNPIFFVTLIASGQILVGIFLFMKRTLFLLGILGGIIFLIAISPLGIGSAFPSTVLMAISLVLLYFRYKKASNN